MKASEFTHVFPQEDAIGLYHSLTIEVAYVNKKAFDLFLRFRNPHTVESVVSHYPSRYRNRVFHAIQQLERLGFLVPAEMSEKSLIENFKAKMQTSLHITNMYLITSDGCNFRCRYCAILKNYPKSYRPSNMSWEIAKKAIDFFIQNTAHIKGEKKELVFYGGEPLLNPNVVVKAIKRSREIERKGLLGGPLEIVVITNGALITPELAQHFAENSVKVIVSIDGPKEIHDEMRIDTKGRGTYEEVVKGYWNCKRAGCGVGISLTVATHNVERLEEIIDFFIRELRPVNCGISSLHQLLSKDAEYESISPSVSHVSKRLIEVYEKARKQGLYMEHIARIVRPFVEKRRRSRDCPACGGLILVAPDGEIGLCANLLGTRQFFTGNISQKPDLTKDATFNEWNKRSQFNIETCYKCPAISLCGGGCPYEAFVRYGNIWRAGDERICSHSKIVLEWLVSDLWQKAKARFKDENRFTVLKPSLKDRKLQYGKIRVSEAKLPLQSWSQYGEKHH